MRPREDELLDPEIAEQLDAIDATLAGEPVDPRHAEIAELALLLTAARPDGPRGEFGAELDRRVGEGFGRRGPRADRAAEAGARMPAGGVAGAAGGSPGGAAGGSAGAHPGGRGAARPARRRWSSWGLMPGLGLAATAVVAVVAVVVAVGPGGGTGSGGSHVRADASAASLRVGDHAGPMGIVKATTTKDGALAPFRAGIPTPSGAAGAGGTAGSAGAAGASGAAGAGSGAINGTRSGGSTSINKSASPLRGPVSAGPPTSGAAVHGRSAPAITTPASPRTQAPIYHGPAPTTSAAPSTAAPRSPGVTYGAGVTSGSTQSPATTSPSPLPNGRKIIQASILELGTPARRLDAVAQEVFEVARAVNAIVESSNVSSTGGPGASAQFQLRIPSQYLSSALGQLSRLPYANVLSRTDSTTDVNSPYLTLGRQIAAAKARLATLRTQLAAATTETEITSLHAQIAAEKATLSREQSSRASLTRRVDFSNVFLTVQGTTGAAAHRGSGGFGLHQAGHDALRVLEVSAGVALIVLAVVLPLGLLIALGWWVAQGAQRRRRERALDLA